MDYQNIFKGIILGISVSAPLGPVGILCVQRTINKGWFAGFSMGMGAVMADVLYAVIAGFGITFISDFLDDQQLYLRIVGGIFLIYIGYRVFQTNPAKQIRKQQRENKSTTTYKHIGNFLTVFFLTASNPVTIIFFGATFASWHIPANEMSVALVIAGVATGAILWWGALSAIVNIFRQRIRLRNLWWINKITGIFVALLGLAALISLFFYEV